MAEHVDVDDYDEWDNRDVKAMQKEILTALGLLSEAIRVMDNHLDRVLRGADSFLEHGEMHLNKLFNGAIPKPILRRLIILAAKDSEGHDAKP